MDAYWSGTDTETRNMLDGMEVRMVMHVHHKKSQSRKQFEKVLHIVLEVWEDADTSMKARAHTLPTVPLLQPLSTGTTPTIVEGGLTDVRFTGEIADSTLTKANVATGVDVTRKSSDDTSVWSIAAIGEQKQLAAVH